MNTESLMFWLTIISFPIGVVGLAFGIYQTITAEKVKKVNKKLKSLNEEKYGEKYRNLFNTVERLIRDLDIACQIVDVECVNKRKPCGRVSATVNSAMNSTQRLAELCEELNNEYERLFGRCIVDNLAEKLKRVPCIEARGNE